MAIPGELSALTTAQQNKAANLIANHHGYQEEHQEAGGGSRHTWTRTPST